MAWVQVGGRKINTALVCYMEQQADEKLRLYFQGQQNALELDADESRALWKHLKSEDAMAVKDKGSTMVLPKRWSAAPADAVPASATPAKPLQVAVGPGISAPAPVGAAPVSSSQSKPHSGSLGHSSSQQPRSSSHSSSSQRSSSHSQPSSSQHRSSSHNSNSQSSSSKPAEAARVLEFKKD